MVTNLKFVSGSVLSLSVAGLTVPLPEKEKAVKEKKYSPSHAPINVMPNKGGGRGSGEELHIFLYAELYIYGLALTCINFR